jgi:tRNA pseudouridine38-40 synthase
MRSIKLTLAYDGTDFAGWQVQPGRRTVQAVLEAALEKITGQPVRTLASGRTDAGVHALGQVVGLRTGTHLPADVIRRALNAELPRDVAAVEVAEAPVNFHPIRDVVRKYYLYTIHDGPVRDVFRRRYCWHWTLGRLDERAMAEGAQALVGTHDFASFQSSGAERATTVRTVFACSVAREEGSPADRVRIDIAADGFLYNMVRAIVGSLAEVGRGARAPAWIGEVLGAADRGAAGPTAPPEGLFLMSVDYGDCPHAP